MSPLAWPTPLLQSAFSAGVPGWTLTTCVQIIGHFKARRPLDDLLKPTQSRQMTRDNSTAPHGLLEAWRLVPHLRRHARAAPVLLALGFSAAIAETLAVGLGALFLFAVLGQSDLLIDSGGLLGAAYGRIGGLFDGATAVVAAVFFGIIATNAALNYAYQLANAVVMNRIAQDMRDRVHEVYVTVGYRHIQEREPGELINTLSGETWGVADAVYAAARMGVNLSAMAVFGAGLVALSWQIALTAALCAAASFAMQRLLTLPLRHYGAELLAENQILSERMLVSLQGMRTLRAFAQEAYVLRVFSTASSRVRRIAISAERIKALVGPLGELVSLGTIVMIALVAGAAGIDTPIVVAAVMLLFRLQPHLRGLCQRKPACDWRVVCVALPDDPAIPFPLLQDQLGGHPPGGDDVHPVPAVAPQRRGSAARARHRRLP
jgi:ABC-type multidrug transport system fused ATPase/permease subunit